MLALCTHENLYLADPPALKRAASAVSATCALTSPTSITWSSSSDSIFISTPTDISRYNSSGSLESHVFSLADDGSDRIGNLTSKDRGSTLIFSAGRRIHILETLTGNISQTFESHGDPVKCVALSNDATLLASASTSAVHVHNLSLATHTFLRGFPPSSKITTCAFHMHTRTRLLVGCGAHVLVYDTSRSLPTKSIALEKKRIGEIVAIACSPFSKSLVAVACSGGYVSLLDIEKEKGLLRTLPMHVPVTSIAFSAKGDMLFIGTENGKLLLQSLRTLDQAPISVSVSESGSRIVALSVQRKLASDDATKGLNRPLVQQDVNKRPFAPVHSTEARKNGPDVPSRRPKLAISPIASKSHADVSKQRTASGSTVRGLQTSDKAASPTSSPARVSLREQLRRSRTAPAPESPLARRSIETQQRKAFSPPKSPALHARKASTDDMDAAHISVRMENLLPLRQAGVTVKENLAPYAGGAPAVPALSASAVSSISRVPPRTRDTQDVKASRARSRTTSSSGASTISSNALPSHNRLDKLLGVPSISTLEQVASTSRPTSPTQRIPIERRRGHVVTTRSPSPALPSPVEKPLSPEPQTYSRVKGKERMRPGTNVLGLGTPEADLWVRAGESRENEQAGKRVGFTEAHDDGADFDDGHRFEQDVDEVETARGGKKVGAEMHLSPRRNIPGTSSSWTPVPSPLRDPTVLPASPQVKAAQDLLQTLLRDALYDFRQETRQDITGLHLDMLRMGRSWRQEMRASMEELGSELRALREENERLRKENERLRRGY